MRQINFIEKNQLEIWLWLRNLKLTIRKQQKWLKDSEWFDCQCDRCMKTFKKTDDVYWVFVVWNRITPKYFICETCVNKVS
jgi:hypothetical protein